MDGWERLPGRLERVARDGKDQPGFPTFAAALALVLLTCFALQSRVGGYPLYAWLGSTVSVAGLVWALYFLRDLRSWRSIACLQIALSVATIVTSLLLDPSIVGVIAALAAIFTGVDGVKRLSEINKARIDG